jgi:hypothetical protein
LRVDNIQEENMSFVLIGGMDRLKKSYMAVAEQGGHSLKCLSRNECNFNDKIGHPDALIVFTNKVSHEAKRKAVQFANTRNIPLHLVHSCGVSSLKECLKGS